jgi:protein-disulfide isomerase
MPVGRPARLTARRRRFLELAAIVTAAVAVVAIAVAIGHAGPHKASSLGSDAAAVRTRLAGVPQRGTVLGRPNAPLTVVEFADLECPFCAQFDRNALPGVIDHYVRTGRVRLELRLLSFIGPDSATAARVANAAAAQGGMWGFSDLFFHNQGQEGTHYANSAFLHRIASATPGLNAGAALAGRDSPAVTRALALAANDAQRYGVSSVPSFVLLRHGRPPQRLALSSLTSGGFASALNSALQA